MKQCKFHKCLITVCGCRAMSPDEADSLIADLRTELAKLETENKFLTSELSKLAIESKNRSLEVARIEAEIIAVRDIFTKEKEII